MHTSNVMMTKYRTGRQRMRDGIEIAYWEAGSGPLTILLLHGWACDHTFLLPQLEYFSRSHRVIAVDLRGHGQSDAPDGQYALAEFAEDIHELITALRVSAAVVVGHSMGGQVALELVARHPDDLSAICLIDSVLFPSVSLSGQLRCILPELAGPEYLSVLSDAAGSLFIETDDPARRAELLEKMARTPQHVAVAAFRGHLLDYDFAVAVAACEVPVAYLGATRQLADLDRFRSLCPQLMTGQTLGSGHFSPLEVPRQINSMLDRFFAIAASHTINAKAFC
jgi:pimeloyl-ACP methyl ester carboxylesterase